MKTTIYLIRHGESEANAASRFAGFSNFPLSERGHRQAACTAEYLRNVPIDCMYASDLLRAYATAEHIAALHHLPVQIDTGMREVYAGRWEGLRFDEIAEAYPEDYRRWKQDIGRAWCTGGENVAALQKRILAAVYRIAADNRGKTVCIGTHATPIRTIQCHCMGLPLSEMHTVPWVTNASVSCVVLDDAMQITDSFFGRNEHLGSLAVKISPKV